MLETPERSPEMNARIAYICKWRNPAMWQHGRWFHAYYVGLLDQKLTVSVRRVVNPDDKVVYHILGPDGMWWTLFDESTAKLYLTAVRKGGAICYAPDQENISLAFDIAVRVLR